jgi:hypothetical protein
MDEPESELSDSQRRFDEFFSEGLERHARAEEAAGGTYRRVFRIAGAAVEFRFAGPALVSLLCDALAHLEVNAPQDADFTFHIFDEASTGIGPPRTRWDAARYFGHGEVPSLIDAERYLQVIQPRRQVIAGRRPSRRAVVWFRSPAQMAARERAAPLRTLINWWAGGLGYLNVHAAAVGYPHVGALIVGRPGAGKSHTALACLDSNLFYVSDDLSLLAIEGDPRVAGLYSTAKLFVADVHRFPMFERHASDALRTEEGKAIFFLNAIVPERLSVGFPIRAILLPHQSGRRDTTVAPASGSAALLALAADNVIRWPSFGRTAFPRLAAVLRSLPCFRIETGTDVRQIPRTIGALLDALPAR